MNSKVLDRGYAHALGLGVTILVTTGLIACCVGPDFPSFWMVAPWIPWSVLAIGLYLTIQTIQYAVRAGFHWPLNYVAFLAAVYAPFALENWGIPVAAGLMMVKYRPGIILSFGYGSLCVCVSAYWFVFERFTAPKATKRSRDSLWLFSALAATTMLIAVVVWSTLPRWVSHNVLIMQEAARHGDLHAVELAIESGVDPRAKDRTGWDTLMWAVFKEREEIVAYLLDHGADPNTREDQRPIVAEGNKIEGNLWEDPDVPSHGVLVSGRSVLNIAISRGNPEIARMLIERGANLSDADVCGAWNPNVLKLLLEKGERPKTGQTGRASVFPAEELKCALSRAACAGELESVKLLLSHGADPNPSDPYIEKARKCAVGAGYNEIIKLLSRP